MSLFHALVIFGDSWLVGYTGALVNAPVFVINLIMSKAASVTSSTCNEIYLFSDLFNLVNVEEQKD